MQVALEVSPPVPFALVSPLCAFLYPQGSAGAFPSRPSEVYTRAHGASRTFGTHLSALWKNGACVPCMLVSTALVRSLLWTPCSVRYYKLLTLVFLESAELIEVVECTRLPLVHFRTLTNTTGRRGVLVPQLLVMSSANSRE